MTYFNEDFSQFFKDLAANNNRDWFQSNKKRYESSVKKPFYHFLEDLISEVKKDLPSLDLQPKNCVARINRDIRFSKDKTPYNTHFSGFISEGGRKDSSKPGIAFRFSPESLTIMGGCYVLDKDQLYKVRAGIAKDLKRFKKVISHEEFVRLFGEIKGDVNKRLDREFIEPAQKEPFLFNKQFYYFNELDSKEILSDKLIETMMTHWHAAKPVNMYFQELLK